MNEAKVACILVVALLACTAAELRNGMTSAKHAGLGKRKLSGSQACPLVPQPLPKVSFPLPAAVQDAVDDFGSFTETLRATSGSMGLASVLVWDQTVLGSFGFGKMRKDDLEDTITPRTSFKIGSVSKLFTTLQLLTAQDRGIVAKSDHVTKYEPNYAPKLNGKTASATFEDLLSHEAGLTRYGPCVFSNCSISNQEALERLKDYSLLWPPGTRAAYSNTGFSVAGRSLEIPTKQTWEDFVITGVAKPLQMDNTFATRPSNLSNVAFGYDSNGNEISLPDLGWSNPAGNVYSSALDMAEILKLVFRTDQPRGATDNQILDGTTLREWMKPRYTDVLKLEDGYVEFAGFGMPWEIFQVQQGTFLPGFASYKLFTKDGDVPGYQAMFLTQPDLKVGAFFVKSTSTSGSFENPIILNFALSVVPQFYKLAKALHKPNLPANVQDFVGTFVSSSLGASVPIVFNETLQQYQNTDSSGTTPLLYMGADTMMPDVSAGGCQNYLSLTFNNLVFYRDSAGEVAGFKMPGYYWDVEFVKQPSQK